MRCLIVLPYCMIQILGHYSQLTLVECQGRYRHPQCCSWRRWHKGRCQSRYPTWRRWPPPPRSSCPLPASCEDRRQIPQPTVALSQLVPCIFQSQQPCPPKTFIKYWRWLHFPVPIFFLWPWVQEMMPYSCPRGWRTCWKSPQSCPWGQPALPQFCSSLKHMSGQYPSWEGKGE